MIWKIIFFPPEDKRHSPTNYVNDLKPSDQAILYRSIHSLQELDPILWPKYVKIITYKNQNIYQLTKGPHRLFFNIYKDKLVFCYACRKVTQKAKSIDLKRAISNWNYYVNRGKLN